MSTTKRFEMTAIILGIVLVISCVANAEHSSVDPLLKYDRRDLGQAAPDPGAAAAAGGGCDSFDISTYPGAKGDGACDSTQALNKAFADACHASGPSKLIIPEGIWLAGALDWKGPCSSPLITIQLQGTLKAKPDVASFPGGQHINIYSATVQLVGGGTIDGNGETLQKQRKQGDKNLPDTLTMIQCPNSGLEGIKFVNAKGFNLKVVECENFKANGISITCGAETLNTDGIHIARSKGASITNAKIAVGDDCISIGDATVDFTIKNVVCGPGHGISIGSLGRFPDEKDVRNLLINNVTFLGTTNGVRIKTLHNNPAAITVANITYSDITVKDIYNPIVIDQHYNMGMAAATSGTSKVKISGVTFKNIKGTTLSNMAVSLNCSSTDPCDGITLDGVAFTYTGKETDVKGLITNCENTKPSMTGSTIPPCAAA